MGRRSEVRAAASVLWRLDQHVVKTGYLDRLASKLCAPAFRRVCPVQRVQHCSRTLMSRQNGKKYRKFSVNFLPRACPGGRAGGKAYGIIGSSSVLIHRTRRRVTISMMRRSPA
jgi:hypothetical protein